MITSLSLAIAPKSLTYQGCNVQELRIPDIHGSAEYNNDLDYIALNNMTSIILSRKPVQSAYCYFDLGSDFNWLL